MSALIYFLLPTEFLSVKVIVGANGDRDMAVWRVLLTLGELELWTGASHSSTQKLDF